MAMRSLGRTTRKRTGSGNSNSPPTTAAPPASPATIHHRHVVVQQNHHQRRPSSSSNSNYNSADEETASLVRLFNGTPTIIGNDMTSFRSSSPTLHDDGSPAKKPSSLVHTTALVVCLRKCIQSCEGGVNKSRRRPVVIKILIWALIVCLVVERFCFNLKFFTMGRPTWLYGTPSSWDDVKGCLLQEQSETQQTETLSHLPLDPSVLWEWKRYGSSSDNDNGGSSNHTHALTLTSSAKRRRRRPRRRLLVAQYTGFGTYAKMLQEVAPVNKAYAKRWGHDYVSLQGTAIRFPAFFYGSSGSNGEDDDERSNNATQKNCQTRNYEAQSTFDKIPLLLRALECDEDGVPLYDQVLILDTDAMIVDFDFDLTTLLLRHSESDDLGDDSDEDKLQTNNNQHDFMLSAYRVWWHDWTSTWDVNAGITLWNLHHPLTRTVAEIWWRTALDRPRDVLLKNDDQFFLQRALINLGYWQRRTAVRTVRQEMEYYDGTVIKHFKRDARSWSRTGLDQRILRIQEVKTTVCQKWQVDCQSILDDDNEEEPLQYSQRVPPPLDRTE